jgi:nitrite reductase (cytochrome c-552)
LAVIAIVAAGLAFLVTWMILSISDKKGEPPPGFSPVVQLTATTYDAATWGQNFPNQYDGWQGTAVFKPTAHEAALVPRTPTAEDPRTATISSKLQADPRLKDMWAGNAFSLDYRHLRGHFYMMEDQAYTLRVLEKPQPGACLNCHASLPEVLNEINANDTMAAWADMNKMTYADAAKYAKGPVSCIDCHDPDTMALRVTRPALINGLKALKNDPNYDVNASATTQEMRTYVCAQCHIEYYFAGDAKTLTAPWANGVDADNVFDYYQTIQFGDFTHAKTDASIIKIQHPEFETWSEGVHAANGVTCADCHMPYQREGSQKVSNHDVASPMDNINGTCGKCHTASEQVLKDRVTTIQNRHILSRDKALDALTKLIAAIEKAKTDGTPQTQIDLAMQYHRQAGMYTDWVYSENSYGFHAPDYMQRLANEALDAAYKGQLALLGVPADQLAASDVATTNAGEIEKSGHK